MEFILRDWKEDDAESVAYHANNKKIADNLRDAFPYPYDINTANNFIEMCIGSDKTKCRMMAIDVEGKAVGSIGVFLKDDVYRKSMEIGYWLSEEYWGKGMMTEAIRQMTKMAFDSYDIVRVFAEPFANNMGSRKVLEKADFQLEGILKRSVIKNNEIIDSCIYAIVK